MSRSRNPKLYSLFAKLRNGKFNRYKRLSSLSLSIKSARLQWQDALIYGTAEYPHLVLKPVSHVFPAPKQEVR